MEYTIRDRILNVLFEDCKVGADSASYADKLMKIPRIKATDDMYEELKEADRVICELCKRLNPQHVTMDSHLHDRGCEWCQDRESRLQALMS